MADFKDLYLKYSKNPSQLVVEEDDLLRVIVQKIEMILFTEKGEVLGNPNFGADLQRYLHETKVSAAVVKQDLEDQFEAYIPELTNVPFNLDIMFVQDPNDFRDIMLIDITVRDYELNIYFN